MPPSADDTVSVVEQTSFVASDRTGDLRPGTHHGYFSADTRFLSVLTVRLAGKRPQLLSVGRINHRRANFYLTNPRLGRLPASRISMVREREVGDTFRERIALTSHHDEPIALRLDLELKADFADIFEARGRRRRRRSVAVEHGDTRTLRFTYEHGGYRRSTTARFNRSLSTSDRGLHVPVKLRPGVSWELVITVVASANGAGRRARRKVQRAIGTEVDAWARRMPRIQSQDARVERAWRQAVADIESLLLRSSRGGYIVAAGLPWFLAVFGRDAAICARQTLPLGPEIAIGTLRELAAYQGRVHNRFREEEPGKLPHEVRTGELALLEEIPHARYYGSVDATPLFVTLFVDACRWSGWLDDHREASAAGRATRPMPAFLSDLLPAAEAALNWIDQYGSRDDGLVWFERQHPRGYTIQAWKDSDDSYRFSDGRLAEPPIAAVEVQGYVYEAKLGMADVYEALGRSGAATDLRREARLLADVIDARFWLPDEGFFAMGLDRHGRPIDSVTSNPGHLLWSGAISHKRASAVGERLLAGDLFSGWGIRTMSSRAAAYNPLSYHNGSVWPHDNSLIAAGLARYGQRTRAWTVIDALLESADGDPVSRLPELFAGYSRAETPHIVPYPGACAPQAWASGAIVLAVRTIMGMTDGHRPLNAAPRVELSVPPGGPWKGSPAQIAQHVASENGERVRARTRRG